MEAAVREHIRAELDERKRRRMRPTDRDGLQGLASTCYEATRGDPLLALDLALERIAQRGRFSLSSRP